MEFQITNCENIFFKNDSYTYPIFWGRGGCRGLAVWDDVSFTRRTDIYYVQQLIIQLGEIYRGLNHSEQKSVINL